MEIGSLVQAAQLVFGAWVTLMWRKSEARQRAAKSELDEANAKLAAAQTEQVASETLRGVVQELSRVLGEMSGKRETHSEWDDEMIQVLRDSGVRHRTPPPLY